MTTYFGIKKYSEIKNIYIYSVQFDTGLLTWPQELAILIKAEPIHMENLWHLVTGIFTHTQPVFHVLAKVVSEKWSHGKGISHHCF